MQDTRAALMIQTLAASLSADLAAAQRTEGPQLQSLSSLPKWRVETVRCNRQSTVWSAAAVHDPSTRASGGQRRTPAATAASQTSFAPSCQTKYPIKGRLPDPAARSEI